jgi:hypothetical protein
MGAYSLSILSETASSRFGECYLQGAVGEDHLGK